MGKRKAEARDAYVIVSAERPPPPSHELSPAEKAYVKWMKRRGIVLNGVGVGRFPRTGRGCVATRDIAPGDVLVSVPEDAIITAETSVAADALTKFGLGGDAMSAEASPRLEREALVLAVLAEMSRGHESDFAPYLAALPTLRATHSPLAWSGAELAELEGTSALDHLMQMEDEALELPSMTAEHWRHVARPFLEANPEFARAPGGVRRRRDAGEDDDDIDDEEGDEADDDEADAEVLEAQKMYLHAAALVAGFSFTLGGGDDDDDDDASDSEGGGGGGGGGTTQAMVPFWDMLNHASPLDASVRLTHDPDARELRMVATKRVPAGAEVFNTYGPLGDAELLRRYGFTLRKNPHGGGVECGVRELMAAASMARYTAETAEIHRFADDPEDRDADDDADDSDEDSDEDSESDSDDDDDDDDEDDETDDEYDLGIGEVSRKDMMDRLRWLRRRGILSNSRDKFYVSRTGRPSVALRHAVRVLSMHRFQFGVLRAADAYERGERDDQTGAYSDEDDDDDEDGFGGAKPMTTSQIWDGAGVDDDDSDLEERQDQMSRVAVALVALAETALTVGRFPTASLRVDVKRLKQLGPERAGERARAGLGGWRAGIKSGAVKRAESGDHKPSWRDEERRAMHRARMALVVRIREKRALKAMAAWARHPCRSEQDLLPPLRSSDVVERKAGSKVRGACCERDCEREGRTCEAN